MPKQCQTGLNLPPWKALLASLLDLDRSLADGARELRWEPLVALFTALSWWWVKVVPFAVVALWWRDVRAAVAVVVAYALANLLTTVAKDAVDRVRPEAAEAAIELPTSPSFPSGHASGAFASAVALALLVPRARVPALVLAALIASSRVYLGVHYPLDVLVGALLGAAVGALIAWLVAARGATRPRSARAARR